MKESDKRIAKRHKINFIIDIYQEDKLILVNNSVINISNTGCLLKLSYPLKCPVNDFICLHFQERFLEKRFSYFLDKIDSQIVRFNGNENKEVALKFLYLSKNNEQLLNYITVNGLILKEFPSTWQVSR